MLDPVSRFTPAARRMLDRLRMMEQSRFWRLRNAFFSIKHRLGLSAEEALPPYTVEPALELALQESDPYAEWVAGNSPRASDLERMHEVVSILAKRPVVVAVVLVDPLGAPLVADSIASLRRQVYPEWRLRFASIAGGRVDRHALGEAEKADARIESSEVDLSGNVSGQGDFVVFIDAGDVLTPDALYELAVLVNREPDVDVMYSDEDVLGADGRLSEPHFKPDWAEDTFLSSLYVGRLTAVRSSEFAKAGGLRPEYGEAAVDDLILRVTEDTGRITHVPRILYHRRSIRVHRADAALQSARLRAVEAALARRGEHAVVQSRSGDPAPFIIRYPIRDTGRVSIIIPTRDHAEDLERCLASVFGRTTYSDFEVLLIDNDSKEPAALEVIAKWAAREPRLRVILDPSPFNYSRLNNRAVTQSTGTYLLFLNNDTEVVTPDWIEALVEQAQRPAIGAAGGLLLYPDGSVQHAGVVLGIGGVAGHSHKDYQADAPGYHSMLKAICNYSALTGACLMMRRSSFDEVGGFDEDLAVTFNDVDLCLKLRAAGYRNVYLPHVVLVHEESKTRGADVGWRRTARSLREQQIMLDRWGPLIARDPYYSPHLTRDAEGFGIARH